MSSSIAFKNEQLDVEIEDSNCVSSKHLKNDKQFRGAKETGSDTSSTSSTTNELPSSASDTESTVGVRHLAAHPSGLPTFAAAAAAAAPPIPPREKKPRRAGFREQFLQQVRGASINPSHVIVTT